MRQFLLYSVHYILHRYDCSCALSIWKISHDPPVLIFMPRWTLRSCWRTTKSWNWKRSEFELTLLMSTGYISAVITRITPLVSARILEPFDFSGWYKYNNLARWKSLLHWGSPRFAAHFLIKILHNKPPW